MATKTMLNQALQARVVKKKFSRQQTKLAAGGEIQQFLVLY